MKTIKKLIPVMLMTAVIGTTGCRQTEKTEGITAGIEAAQIEGRTVARGLLSRNWNDSIERISDMAVVDSIARQFTDSAMSNAFRRTFESTLRTVRPDLYRKLRPEEE